MELSGKTALLTGATGGLGKAIAEALARRGATLVLSSRRAEELDALATSLPGHGHRVIVADLALEGAARRLVAEAGAVDVLVANAALSASGRLESFEPDQVERALRVNLEAPTLMARDLLAPMQARGSGHLVFVASLSGIAPSPRSSLYAATKFGLRGMALSLREDLRGSGVGASVVLPGFVREAGMFHESGAKLPPGVGTSSPAEVADAVVNAVERDRAEVYVAPPTMRAMARFAARRPELAGRLAARMGSSQLGDQVASGQSAKR